MKLPLILIFTLQNRSSLLEGKNTHTREFYIGVKQIHSLEHSSESLHFGVVSVFLRNPYLSLHLRRDVEADPEGEYHCTDSLPK